MNYFKRLETIIIAVIILLLAISYSVLNDRTYEQPKTKQEPQANVSETLELAPDSISYKGELGKTAMDILKAQHTVTTQNFGGVGEFVKSIDGVEPDSSHFWAFYVNGQQAQVGADQYQTKTSDNIEWKLEEIK